MSYKRVLLKLSGEALQGPEAHGISEDACLEVVHKVKELVETGVEVGIVTGAGNIFRGIQGSKLGIKRTPADQMGMLATVMNGIALREAFHREGVDAVVLSAIDCHNFVEPYSWQKALHYIVERRVVIFAGGTGSPYFTTDTAAALRASEIQAEILMKATKVKGIYSKDPILHPDAIFYDRISFAEAMTQKLKVMDATAFALCMSNNIPIFVFNMKTEEKLSSLLHNKKNGTLVY